MKPDCASKYYTFLLLFFISITGIKANNLHLFALNIKPDTVFLKAGQYILFRDSSFYAMQDTLIILPDSVYYVTEDQQLKQSESLYDSLAGWAHKKPWIYNLMRLMIVQNAQNKNTSLKQSTGPLPFQQYAGKKIRRIRLAKVDVFGPGVNDTVFEAENNIQKFLNKTHINTRDKTILHNLVVKEGEVLIPARIKDNERILRNLPFIRDARLIVIPVIDDQVDILVITQDQYSLGFKINPDGLNKGSSGIFEKNFLGYGHDLEFNLLYNFNEEPATGFNTSFMTRNLFGSFIQGEISFTNAFENQSLEVTINRKFLTPETKYSYGLVNSVVYTTENFDTTLSQHPLKYNYQDYWLGRAVIINSQRDRIMLSVRFINNNIYERPQIGENEYHRLQRYRLLLGSLSFSKEDFYKENLIYNFGRTEDIPHGMLYSFTGGIEDNEFFQSAYSCLKISYGNIFPKFGYIYGKAALGAFYDFHDFNRGLAQIHLNYFSPLFHIHRFNFRQFINVDYTRGIGRFTDEKLFLNDGSGIRGFHTDSLFGTQRLTVNFETVAFSPFYLAGFRFAFYTFADLGLIGNNKDLLYNRELYSGLGFGLRIRNENLSFNTLQIRFSFYPVTPIGFNSQFVDVAGARYYRPGRFNPNRPEILLFR